MTLQQDQDQIEDTAQNPAAVDWEDSYKRLLADVANTKKRLAASTGQEIEQAKEHILRDMLSFADNLELALRSDAEIQRCPALAEGVQLTLRAFQNTLKKYGVTMIDALNQPFDPNLHEASALISHPSQPEGTVVEVVQNGYLRNGRLLRAAKVLVSSEERRE
ncbi:MAG: nucleotide exchange factor GrpE [Chloroflexota bacterium]